MRPLSSPKVIWSLGISATIWLFLFLLGVSMFAVPRGTGINFFYFGPEVILLVAAAGTLVTWPVLWVGLSIGDALLRLLGRAARSFGGWSRWQKFVVVTVLLFLVGAAGVPTIAYFAARSSQPSQAAQLKAEALRVEAEALRVAGGHPPPRCEGGAMPPPEPTGPTRRLVGTWPVWLQFATVGTITARSDDLVLTELGTVLLRPRTMSGNLADKVITFWAVSDKYSGSVVVRIIDASTGDAVWALDNEFDVRGGTTSSGYLTQVVYFHIQHAGCYMVEAAWPGGSWRAPLAAGH